MQNGHTLDLWKKGRKTNRRDDNNISLQIQRQS